ncbi:MAG: SdrD B-like domain-containing protein [Chloroflexota bacterium]
MRRLICILTLAFAISSTAAAAQQTGGQLCVRSFEDRNGNGKLDAGEPLLTRGVSINLLDAGGITVASALLDTSPTAAQGVVCFQFLAAGQYSVVVTSADFNATTPATVTTTIQDDSVPTVVEFGGQRIGTPTLAPAGSAAAPQTSEDELVRLVISIVGAIIVVAGMVFLGILVYAIAFRGRRPSQQAALDPRTTTGSMRAVQTRDTSEHPHV